jgi:hypothetical protein
MDDNAEEDTYKGVVNLILFSCRFSLRNDT